MKSKILFLLALTAALAFCCGLSSTAQNTYATHATLTVGNIHLSADDPRPLAQALDALQLEYHWPISYEDPQYVVATELAEIPNPDDPKKRMKVPGGHAFNVDFPGGKSPSAAPDEEKTLQLVVDAYNRSGNPGQFEITKVEDRIDVIGRSARDAQGKAAKQTNPLDLMITLPSQARTGRETVDAICQLLSTQGKYSVSSGIAPGFMNHLNLTIGGDNMPARTLLLHTLAATKQPVIWRLLFDPDSNSYVLMLHLVKPHS